MSAKHKFFILTGEPGVGKTTLIKKISSILNDRGIKTAGFYTEEFRKDGLREGFDVVNLDGRRDRLALLAAPSKHKVGKYGVFVDSFEGIALPSLEMPTNNSAILVIDEIGKMELFSELFKCRIRDIFSLQSECVAIATIPVRKSDQLIEKIRNDSRAKLWKVTRENRNKLCEEIVNEIVKVFLI